ncbi:MAG: hypothetical protein AB7F86_10715 [Bdellovibrionales bacterium]
MTGQLMFLTYCLVLVPLVVIFWQALLNRILKGQSAQKLTMASMVLGYPLYFAMVEVPFFEHESTVALYAFLFLLYSFGAYTYFHVFNMSETSRRIRMIVRIGRTPGCTLDSLKDLYHAEEMINVRLDRLVALGQIEKRDGRFYPRGKLFSRTAAVLYGVGTAVARPWPELRVYKEENRSGTSA